jgi:hypothetical protein
VAENFGNIYVNTNGRGMGRGRREKVKADVKRAFSGVLGETTCRFSLDVMLSLDKA